MMMKMRFWALMTLLSVMTLVSFNATSLLETENQPTSAGSIELGEISAESEEIETEGQEGQQNTPVAELVTQTAKWVMEK